MKTIYLFLLLNLASITIHAQCQLEILFASEGTCDDAGTPSDPADDVFSAIVNAAAINPGPSQQYYVDVDGMTYGPADYNTPIVVPNLHADGVDISVNFYDADDNSCSASTTVSQLSCSPDCVVVPTVTPGLCNDNGTPTDPNDDFFSVLVEVEGFNTAGVGYFVVYNNIPLTGMYGDAGVNITNIPADGQDYEISVFDFNGGPDPTCMETFTVSRLPCSFSCVITPTFVVVDCDNGGTGPDPADDTFTLEVSATALNSVTGSFWVTINTVPYGPYLYGETTLISGLPTDATQSLNFFDAVVGSPCSEPGSILVPSCSGECDLFNITTVIGACNDNNTTTNPLDDFFFVIINASAINGTQFEVTADTGDGSSYGPFVYNSGGVIGPFPATSNTIALTITDTVDPTCQDIVHVVQLPCSGDCILNIINAEATNCNDNGTPTDPSDDTYTYTIAIEEVNGSSAGFYIDDGFNPLVGPIPYYQDYTSDPLPCNQFSTILTFYDAGDLFGDCETFFIVECDPCSDMCELTANANVGPCNDGGTPSDPLDDIFDLTVNATTLNGGATFFVTTDVPGVGPWGGLPYVAAETLTGLPANGVGIELIFSDSADPTCQDTILVSQDPCSSQCILITDAVQGPCNNDGTPFDITDDFFFIDVTVDAINGSGTEYIAEINGAPISATILTYGVTETLGPIPADGTVYDIVFSDALISTCSTSWSFSDLPCFGPCELVLELDATNQSCNNDGAATVNPVGGAAPYTFEWSTGETTQSVNNLQPGWYFVVTFDVNGCVAEAGVFIEPPFDLEVSSTHTACDEDAGTAAVTLSSSIENPVYAWSNGATENPATGLAAGWYSVTVTDPVTSCFTHENVEVEQDPDCYALISGYVYDDSFLQNCNANEVVGGVPNIMLFMNNGDITFSGPDGYFEFVTTPGIYTLNIVLNTDQFQTVCAQSIIVTPTNWGDTSTDNNFFLKYATYTDLEVKVVKGPARPGFQQYVRVCAMNNGDSPMAGTVSLYHDPLQSFAYASPAESGYNSSEQLIQWSFTNLPPGQIFVYYAYLNLPSSTPVGTPLNFDFIIEPLTDNEPDNNFESCTSFVTGSYDPNDKKVSPEGVGPDGLTLPQDSVLTYAIRFQNTGNDTAFTVVLRDTIDAALDIFSVIPLPSADEYTLDVLDGHVLEFAFKNIMLPDSTTNEQESHGFAIYKIELQDNLPSGTTIENRVGIYFDYNEPIITNTTLNTFIDALVWPGDADRDSTVTQYDLLHLGIAHGNEGPLRPLAALDWPGALCLDWATATPESSIDYKHIDMNGDGQVEISDLLAIELNWGATIIPGIQPPVFLADTGAGLDLYIELEPTTAGVSLSVPVMLEGVSGLVENAYGLALNIRYDTSLIEPGSVMLSFENSWLGEAADLISVQKDFYEESYIGAAVTRIDGLAATGSGEVALLDFIIQDDILFLENEQSFMAVNDIIDLVFTVENVKLIDAEERLIPLNYGSTSTPVISSINQQFLNENIQLSPNPTGAEVFIVTNKLQINAVRIFSLTGELLYENKEGENSFTIDTKTFENGTYLVEVLTEAGSWQEKLIVLR